MHGVRRAWFVALALAAVSFVGSLVVGHAFFENLSINNDEAVYVLEAQSFGNGELTLSDSAHGDSFRPWMSGRVEGDRLVLVEQPILPAFMALTDRVFGSMRVAVALVAAGAVLAMFALTRELLHDDRVALVAAGCFVFSPLVIVQSAMYLSYVLAVALAATTLTLVTRGLDRRAAGQPAAAWLLGAGTVHGILLFTRPLEGLVLGAVILIWMAVRRVDRHTFAYALGLLVVGAIPVVAATLVYNELTTGNPLKFALWTIGGDDSFGFGLRSVAEHAEYVHVGPAESWLALRTNLRAFPHWIFAGLVSVPLGAWGAWRLWHTSRRVLYLMVAMLIAYPAAYFYYYGNYLIIGGRNFYGPHYYLPVLIPAMVLLAVAIVDLFTRHRPWGLVVLPLVIMGMAIEVEDKIRDNLAVRDDVAAEVNAVESVVEEPAIVILPAGVDGPYVLHPRGALGNPPDLDAATLFAADLGGRNLELADRFPDRHFYRMQMVATSDGVVPQVRPLRIIRGVDLEFRVASLPTPGRPDTVTYVDLGSQRVPCLGPARPGAVVVELGPGEAAIDGCSHGPLRVAVKSGPMTVAFGVTDSGGGDEGAIEVRYWARIGTDGVAAMDPGEIWTRRPGGEEFEVASPTLVPWVRGGVVGRSPREPA